MRSATVKRSSAECGSRRTEASSVAFFFAFYFFVELVKSFDALSKTPIAGEYLASGVTALVYGGCVSGLFIERDRRCFPRKLEIAGTVTHAYRKQQFTATWTSDGGSRNIASVRFSRRHLRLIAA